MLNNLVGLKSIFNISIYNKKIISMKTSKSYKDLFCPSYNFYPNKITNIIELNEDKEE